MRSTEELEEQARKLGCYLDDKDVYQHAWREVLIRRLDTALWCREQAERIAARIEQRG